MHSTDEEVRVKNNQVLSLDFHFPSVRFWAVQILGYTRLVFLLPIFSVVPISETEGVAENIGAEVVR